MQKIIKYTISNSGKLFQEKFLQIGRKDGNPKLTPFNVMELNISVVRKEK
jgi:hypothetical protein